MRDEEARLWERYNAGEPDALEGLVLYYLPLVKLLARRVLKVVYWADRQDIIQEGIVGLLDAIEHFNFDGLREFRPYARRFIRGAMLRNTEVARDFTRYQHDNYRKVKKAYSNLLMRLEREPTLDEIALEAGLSTEQVTNALSSAAVAFAEAITDQTQEPETEDWSPDRQYEIILAEEALSRLNEREVMILSWYYWYGLTDREVGERLGVKRDTAKKARSRALEKLRILLKGGTGGEEGEF